MKNNQTYFSCLQNKLVKECRITKTLIIAVLLAVLISYSVYLFFNAETVAFLEQEDGLFEWLTFGFFLLAAVAGAIIFRQSKNICFLLLTLVLFFAAGEEISWGQRVFGFETPEKISKVNLQNEFNIHNLATFSTTKAEGDVKHGLERLLELNFLFRLFTIGFGIVLPFLVYQVNAVDRFAKFIHLPVPPLSIGIFFFINWLIFWSIHKYMHVQENITMRHSEVYESLAAFILLIIMLYFLNNRKTTFEELKKTD